MAPVAATPTSPPAAAATPAAPPDGPLPQASLATLVAASRRDADGTQSLTLRLHPDELGPVEVMVQMHRGVVSVSLDSTSPAAREALTGNLGQLRHALTEAGVNLGSLDVGTGRGNAQQQGAPKTAGGAPADDEDPTEPAPNDGAPTTAGTGVDLHL
jgi:flagellar hook-length control protein FliK